MGTATIAPWVATCVQMPTPNTTPSKNVEEARAIVHKSLDACDAQLQMAAARRADLVLFPEYILGGPEDDMRGVIDFPGPEIERVQKLAQKYKVFIGAHAYARDAMFPGRYFNVSFLVNRSGDVVLKFNRIHTYHSHSPHDFWQRFLDKVGIEGAFPVARTELGNIAMMPSMELMFPEIARMFTLRGAEVILHDTAEAICDVSVKRTRAVENMVFLMSANTPAQIGPKSMRVGSRIIDWEGEVMAEVADGKAGQCTAILDVEGLRQRRSDSDVAVPAARGYIDVNYLARLRTEVVRDIYNATSLFPIDTYKDGTTSQVRVLPERTPESFRVSMDRMVETGMISRKYMKS